MYGHHGVSSLMNSQVHSEVTPLETLGLRFGDEGK